MARFHADFSASMVPYLVTPPFLFISRLIAEALQFSSRAIARTLSLLANPLEISSRSSIDSEDERR
jgi:hypothetical protein